MYTNEVHKIFGNELDTRVSAKNKEHGLGSTYRLIGMLWDQSTMRFSFLGVDHRWWCHRGQCSGSDADEEITTSHGLFFYVEVIIYINI